MNIGFFLFLMLLAWGTMKVLLSITGLVPCAILGVLFQKLAFLPILTIMIAKMYQSDITSHLCKVLKFLGTHSLELYVTHLLIYIFLNTVYPNENTVIVALFSLFLSIMISFPLHVGFTKMQKIV